MIVSLCCDLRAEFFRLVWDGRMFVFGRDSGEACAPERYAGWTHTCIKTGGKGKV